MTDTPTSSRRTLRRRPPSPARPPSPPRPPRPPDAQRPGAVWEAYFADRSAANRNTLVERYMPFVARIAKRVRSRLTSQVDVADLEATGAIGLIDAVERFDPSRKVSFKTFAGYRIRGAMLDALRQMEWEPRMVRHRASRIESIINQFWADHGRRPADEELAGLLGILPENLWPVMLRATVTEVCSLDAMLASRRGPDQVWSEDLTRALSDDSQPPDVAAETDEFWARATRRLPYRKRLVVLLYYTKGRTMQQIQAALRMPRKDVREILIRFRETAPFAFEGPQLADTTVAT